jgi:hypothetical protein
MLQGVVFRYFRRVLSTPERARTSNLRFRSGTAKPLPNLLETQCLPGFNNIVAQSQSVATMSKRKQKMRVF